MVLIAKDGLRHPSWGRFFLDLPPTVIRPRPNINPWRDISAWSYVGAGSYVTAGNASAPAVRTTNPMRTPSTPPRT